MKLKLSLMLNGVLLVAVFILAAQNALLRLDRSLAEHYHPKKKHSFDELALPSSTPSELKFEYRLNRPAGFAPPPMR
jgi:hypothetical protein